MRVASVDCGTNSIRLLVADSENGVLTDLHREMIIVRLGENIDKTGEFASSALDRTFKACEKFAAVCEKFNVEKIRFVATSATRDAKNKEVFLKGVERILNVTPEVISGDQEATLSFNGAVNVLGEKTHKRNGVGNNTSGGENLATGGVLVVDIGGGSTEFVLGNTATTLSDTNVDSSVSLNLPSVDKTISVDMGCVRMTERFFRTQDGQIVVDNESVDKAKVTINEHIGRVAEVIDFSSVNTFIGLAGSITTIAGNYLRLGEYDPKQIHGTEMTFTQAISSCEQLLYSSKSEREKMGFLHPKRADVIMGGALVFRQILEFLQSKYDRKEISFNTVTISEHDILDGIALSIK